MITLDLPGLSLPNTDSGTDPYLRDTNWYDTADMKLDVEEREDGDGAFDQDPIFDQAFYLDIEGGLITSDPTAVFELRKKLVALKRLGKFPVSATDPTGTFTRQVRIRGKIGYPIEREDGVVIFSIPLIAKDPLKYGPEEVVSTGLPTGGGGIAFPITFPLDFGAPGTTGRVVTTNSGDADTYSVIDVTGGLAGGFSAVCVELGQEIRFERAIPVGSTVSVDMATGQAFIDGQSPVSGFFTRADWWSVPAEGFRTIQFNAIGAVTGTPTLTARTSPANN